MTVYPDASLVIAVFTHEPFSEAAREWFTRVSASQLASSKWCETEAASALATKVRTWSLPEERYDPLLDVVRQWVRSTLVLAVEEHHFTAATRLVARRQNALRGGDALHLAIAADAGATLWTLDRKMAAAGQALALDVRLLA